MHIMQLMVHNQMKSECEVINMEEKTYKTMNGAGALNIVVGVISIVVGVACGVLMIISGAKLLAGKTKILF